MTRSGFPPVQGIPVSAIVFLALASLLVQSPSTVLAQETYSKGQSISPAYEGWEQNPDGSFNFLFGYMNRNWLEEPDIPVGVDNSFSPGPADRGQPTHFRAETVSYLRFASQRIGVIRNSYGLSPPTVKPRKHSLHSGSITSLTT